MSLLLRFWGVRGSVPTPQAENLSYGGNTSCLEVRCDGGPPLIFDAGTGIRRLGLSLLKEFERQGGTASLFLTHFHWDHIQGLPFFAPLYQSAWRLAIHAACAAGFIEKTLGFQLKGPYFTAESAIRAECSYAQVGPGGMQADGLAVRAFPVFHPGGAVGYRVESPRASIVYITDHEHGDRSSDAMLRRHARGADILIYDAQFTPQEHAEREGWGHSTWAEAARLAKEAGAGQLILFHHDPEHDDQTVSAIVAEAAQEFPNTLGATEGWSISL